MMCQADCCPEIRIRDSSSDPCCRSKMTEGDVLAETCDDLIRSVHFLREIVNMPGDGFVAQRHLDVMGAVADLTQAVVTYLEPDAGMEPN